MAYDPTKPPIQLVQATDKLGVWLYQSPDPHATTEGAGYFSNAGKIGMRVGDIVIVSENSAGGATVHTVTAVAAAPNAPWDMTPGAATISAAQFT
jgi:hypothetical protein